MQFRVLRFSLKLTSHNCWDFSTSKSCSDLVRIRRFGEVLVETHFDDLFEGNNEKAFFEEDHFDERVSNSVQF